MENYPFYPFLPGALFFVFLLFFFFAINVSFDWPSQEGMVGVNNYQLAFLFFVDKLPTTYPPRLRVSPKFSNVPS